MPPTMCVLICGSACFIAARAARPWRAATACRERKGLEGSSEVFPGPGISATHLVLEPSPAKLCRVGSWRGVRAETC